ncbi:MAG: glycosyl hydrolase 108 family protein [Hyphomonas sp.]|uniref:glycoside hydrolase family 108 protein n=1 Tax=Hyphomonas sp. TaxID=87 RepID=UPI00326590D5
MTVALYSENFLMSFAETMAHEGGYVNHPDDPGGMTFAGITRKAWAAYKGVPMSTVTEQDMRNIPLAERQQFYHELYWCPVGADDLPGGLDFVVWDISVNSGPGRAVKMLQKAINKLGRVKVRVDGVIGPKTLSAARYANVFDLIDEVGNTRLWFYFDLSTFRTFGKGWMKRLLKVTSFGTAMALGRAKAVIMSRQTYRGGA